MAARKTNKLGPWKVAQNTDTADIDQRCLGLDVRRGTIPSDVWDHIATNRGLHIQIRHNRDPQTFGQASDLSKFIAVACNNHYKLLAALKNALKYMPELSRLREDTEKVIAKVEGK